MNMFSNRDTIFENRIIINNTEDMKYLIVVAHPDDEVLGAGASIWKWAHNGD